MQDIASRSLGNEGQSLDVHMSNHEGDKEMEKKITIGSALVTIVFLLAFLALAKCLFAWDSEKSWAEQHEAKFTPTSEQTVTVRGVQETPLWEK